MNERGGLDASKKKNPENIDSAKKALDLALLEIEQAQAALEKKGQVVSIDYRRIRRRMAEATAENIPGLIDALFQEGVPPRAIRQMAESDHVKGLGQSTRHTLNSQVQKLESRVKEHFFGSAVIDEAGIIFKSVEKNNTERKKRPESTPPYPEAAQHSPGRKWLERHIGDKANLKKFDENRAHEIQVLGNELAMRYGENAGATARLMFMCAGNDLNAIDRVKQILQARIQEGRVPGMTEGQHFFDSMRTFLSVYSDVTAQVLARTNAMDDATQVGKRSRDALVKFFKHPALLTPQDTRDAVPNPFGIFQDQLLASGNMNPWITAKGEDTPFAIDKFARIISEDVPRGLIAEAASYINNYKQALLAEEASAVVRSVREAVKNKPDVMPENAKKRIKEMVSKAHIPRLSEDTPFKQLEELEAFADKNLIYRGEGIHPFGVLLRILDPGKIVTQSNFRQRIIGDLNSIPIIKDPQEGDNWKKIGMIANSVETILDSHDPNLDVPLLDVGESNLSLRMLITERAQQKWFDDGILMMGPDAHNPQSTRTPRELIIPRDFMDMSEENLTLLAKNFDTAKGIDTHSKRDWILEAAHRWNDLPNSYENILAFSRRQVEQYYRGVGKYAFTFYPSATAAMNDVVSRLLPSIERGDYILISNQEYSGVTDAFTNHGAEVEPVAFNDRKETRAKLPEEIFSEMVQRIEKRGRLPRAIILSSKTRFGDALGVTAGKSTPNSYGLGKLVALLKEKYPSTPVGVDGAQSIGRNDRGETLERLGCDFYINSGAKALGVENVAMLAVRKISDEEVSNGRSGNHEYLDIASRPTQPGKHWLSHLSERDILKNPLEKLSPGKSSTDIIRIAALGMALQIQQGTIDTWKQNEERGLRGREGRAGLEKRKSRKTPVSLRERVTDHMQKLTDYAISKIEDYTESLFTHPQFPFYKEALALLSDASVHKQFGFDVVYPVHRKVADYNGVISITFPNMSAGYLKRELQKQGFVVERVRDEAIRISFHYLHMEANTDALFEAIQNVHVAGLNRLIATNAADASKQKIDSFSALRAASPNLDDSWMEN